MQIAALHIHKEIIDVNSAITSEEEDNMFVWHCLTIKATTAGRGNKQRRFQMQEARMSQAEADLRPEQDSAEERFQVSVNIIQEMSGAQIRSKSGSS